MQSIINRMGWVLAAIVSLVALAAIAGIVHGGPLDPTGTPGPTDGVRRPGTPISSIPFTITDSGNYYLTRSLTMEVPGLDGITVGADNVTLDLGGFTLDGAALGGTGVQVNDHSGVTVRNGVADHWTRGFSWGADGSGVAENLQARRSLTIGIAISNGTLTGCSVEENTLVGVRAENSVVTNCVSKFDGTAFDINGGSLSDCTVESATTAVQLNGGEMHDCVLTSNGTGIKVAVGANVHDNEIRDTQGSAIVVSASGARVHGNSVATSAFGGTSASGILVSGNTNEITHNTVTGGQVLGTGISVSGSFNSIEENTVLGNAGTGIEITGTDNTVVRNIATGNAPGVSDYTNYSIVAGNNDGPLSPAATATNPWANTE